MSWQYKKVDLNQVARDGDEIDALCAAGEDGWELVTILPNNVAYLKREIGEHVPLQSSWTNGQEAPTSEVKAKYRDPASAETWSGRGRMATWLKRKQDAGEDIEKYRV